MGRKKKDFTGLKFNRLTVISQDGVYYSDKEKKYPRQLLFCRCECGNTKVIRQEHVVSGATKSCGCLQKERVREVRGTHCLSRTREYTIWNMMVQRCCNEKSNSFSRYGGRGIKVCPEWNPNLGGTFEKFLLDMGLAPGGKSLERVNNNGNYEISNCMWASKSQQTFNQRKATRNTSGRTGVYYLAKCNKWSARICKDYKQIELGYFTKFEDAVKAREDGELKYYGFVKK